MAHLIKYVVLIIILLSLKYVICFRCERRPYGSTTHASAPDGRFKLSVVGVDDAYYIPEQLYTVQISETDGESRFSGFMISAEGDIRQDPDNPRRVISLSPGNLRPQNTMTSKFSDRCLNSVEHAMSSTKSSVEVYWQAPSSNNGCVTLRAMVAENEDVWFEDGTPLTQTLCEDLRQPDDVTPQMNFQCEICDEAKYEVSFTGIWSRNTHPLLYPENDWIPRFSDLVGASHSVDFILWSPGSIASEGFKVLAQYANSSELEAEILKKIGDGVRTLIKGKGHGYPKMSNPTYSFFRTDNTNHLFTVAIAIYPSPDWFLGVSRFELCQKDNTWLKEREINLYLWDAGTDSGVSYESADILTFPQQAITRVQMSSFDRNSPFFEVDMKDMHPFGKLHVKLIRTYQRECKEETTTTTPGNEVTEAEDTNNIPTSLSLDPESPEECPMSQWQEWSPCYGTCVDGKITGYKWRNRYHLVDGSPNENYEINIDPSTPEEVLNFCEKDFEKDECEDDCSQKDNVSTTIPSDEMTEEKNEETSEPETPSSESPIGIDSESLQNCPMSQWEEWSPCYGACIDGKIVGYNWRKRYHIVDGNPVENDDPNADTSTTKVSRFCKRYFKDFQKEKCRDDCAEEKNEPAMTPNGEVNDDKNEESSEPETPSRYRNSELDSASRGEAPIVTDPESPPDCPISQWQEWSPCDGACVDGKMEGYKWRERYHLVDGIPVEKYDPNADPSTTKEVSSFCKKYVEDFQKEKCKDDCSEEDDNDKINVERRVMVPIAPGNKWSSNRRELHRKYSH